MDSTFNNVKAVITAAEFEHYLSALFAGTDKWQTRVEYKYMFTSTFGENAWTEHLLNWV